jgi:hypothetical protein
LLLLARSENYNRGVSKALTHIFGFYYAKIFKIVMHSFISNRAAAIFSFTPNVRTFFGPNKDPPVLIHPFLRRGSAPD